MSTALQKVDVPIHSMDDLVKVGQLLETSGMFGCKQQGQGLVIAATCIQEGWSFLRFRRQYHLVKGNPTMRADAMLAGMRQIGGKYKIVQRDAERAEIFAKCEDAEGTFSFTWEEAQGEPFVWCIDPNTKKKVIKDNYATPRGRMQMLWARVVSDAVRSVAPEVVAGVYTEEEAETFDERPAYPPQVGEEPAKATRKTRATAETTPPPVVTATATEAVVDAEIVPTEPPPPVADPGVIPFGKPELIGKPWRTLKPKQLRMFLEMRGDKLNDEQKAAIEQAIQDQEG